VQEFLECREIEDLVADGLAAVDGIFLGDLLFGGFLAGAGLREGMDLAYCLKMPRRASSKAVCLRGCCLT
jgi:hypothetical protein